MDRNSVSLSAPGQKRRVALRKESVDRNTLALLDAWGKTVSLSARRAWIEIFGLIILYHKWDVSLSARRAWIEIDDCPCP